MTIRKILFAAAACLSLSLASPQMLRAQRLCGQSLIFQQMAAENPAAYQAFRMKLQQKTEQAEAQGPASGGTAKATAQYPIPVVFHFILDTNQYKQIGRDTGIRRRVASQLAVLNQDYNKANADGASIPAAFKPLWANVGVSFGQAAATNSRTIAAGIEVLKLNSIPAGTFNYSNGCYTAKQGTYGLPAWDVTKYLNIWVVSISNGGSGGTVLGVTASPALVGYSLGGHVVTNTEIGVALNYGAIGSRAFPAQYFINKIDKGRTLTHEIGHFFELRHTWGDDDNTADTGYCPGETIGVNQVGYDDGINDTPPQSRRTYCDFPNHSGTSCPTFPLVDRCSPVTPGVMYMNYMDYVDDAAMMMFTTNQATVMNSFLNSESASLTQNPSLLALAVAGVSAPVPGVAVYPNPAQGKVSLVLEQATGFTGADVMDMMGRKIAYVAAVPGKTSYEMNLATAPRGIYLVQCHYDGGTVTKKLVLE